MRFAPVSVLLALLLSAAPAAAPRAFAAPHLVRTLPNKVNVVVRENRTRPLVAVQVWVGVGTRDESRTERGASSVLAYLGYEATAKRKQTEMQKEVRGFGGTIGSESGYGQTVYSMTAPARNLEQALDVLSDALIRPAFETLPFDQAVAKARRDSRITNGTAGSASLAPIRAALYDGTPLAAPLKAPELEIAALTSSIVQRFFKTHWVAENLTVVIVGDVDAEDAAQKVATAFAGMPRGKPTSKPRVSPKAFSGPRIMEEPSGRETEGSSVTAGFRAPEWGSADAIALDVLMALLVDSPDSRFQRRLREGTGEILSAAAQRSLDADGGMVAISLETDPSRAVDAEGLLVQEIEKTRATPVTKEECDAAIRAVMSRETLSQSEFWGLARATGIAWYQGRPGADEVYWQRLQAVRPEDLVAVARKYLDWRQAAIVEMMPGAVADSLGLRGGLERRIKEKQALYEGTYRTGPQATASADAERRARIDAPLASIAAVPFDAGRGRVERATLPGGLRLLTSEDRSAPSVTISVYLGGGVRYETERTNGASSLLRETMLNSNDPKAPGFTYRQSLERIGRTAPYQDRDMWGVSIAVPSSDWREALDRLGGMFSKPDLDSITVDATRIFLLSALDRWLEDDDAQRQRLIFQTKYEVSGYRFPGIGNRLNLVAMPGSVVEDWHKKFIVRPNLVVAVFGDVRPAEVGPAVEKAFAGVPARPFKPGVIAKELEFTGFREKWELGAGPVVSVQLAFNGPPASSPDMPAMFVVNSLLSNPYGWFEQYLRSQGTVNGAESIVSQAIDESPILATVWIKGIVSEEEMVKLLFRQFKKVAGIKLVGEELGPEFQRAKTHAICTYYSAFTTNTTRAFQWARAEVFGLPPDYAITLPSKMEAIQPDDLLYVGKKYFQTSSWVRAPYAIAETRPGGW
jgi:zinc protease